jgi:O-antigen ligase
MNRGAIKEWVGVLSFREKLFAFWAVVLLGAFALAVGSGFYGIALLPFVLLFFYWAIMDFKALFLVLMACIPLSTEVVLPNGFGTDLPTEPVIIGLMGVALFVFAYRNKGLAGGIFLHPMTVFLLLHLAWIYFSTAQSELFFISFKFSLAKTWYVVVFYFLAYYLLKRVDQFVEVIWWVFWPLLFTVIIILVRHSLVGFSFAEVHKVLHPFQRNHVSYAALLSLFLPYVWLLYQLRQGRKDRLFIVIVAGILLVAVYFSYTRAAYIALAMAVAAYFLFRLRLIRTVLMAGVVVLVIGVGYLFSKNRFLALAPNYETTVAHREFGSLLDATAKGKDISTMERLYRWIAGVEMSRKKPVVGYGPGNFVNFYKPFSITSFRTYVSSNEEQSGIHSYFLMTLVEQGWPGLILFLILSLFLFIRGEQIYHQSQDPVRKAVVMAILLSLVVIYAFLIINDMIETDKVGSFYFLSLAMLVRIDLLNRRDSGYEAKADKNGGASTRNA